jgi:hypothetical protein
MVIEIPASDSPCNKIKGKLACPIPKIARPTRERKGTVATPTSLAAIGQQVERIQAQVLFPHLHPVVASFRARREPVAMGWRHDLDPSQTLH